MSVLTTKEIMEIIPHRQPFLLIDTIEELELSLIHISNAGGTTEQSVYRRGR